MVIFKNNRLLSIYLRKSRRDFARVVDTPASRREPFDFSQFF